MFWDVLERAFKKNKKNNKIIKTHRRSKKFKFDNLQTVKWYSSRAFISR